jgi:enolase-phosphatase E1
MMKSVLDSDSIRTILLDIEGTTTPVDFVYQVLFPYARLHMKDFVTEHFSDEEVQSAIAELHQEHAQDEPSNPPPLSEKSEPSGIAALVSYIHWLMERDKKSTPLKTLQGKIWEAGYRKGDLHGEVYDDVPAAFERWHQQGKTISIYSSGSVLAQKLIFAHTPYGDLTGYIAAYFDTRIGGKKEAESYRQIAERLPGTPSTILFISDVTSELDAARSANLQTLCSVRPGNQPIDKDAEHPIIKSFAEVLR